MIPALLAAMLAATPISDVAVRDILPPNCFTVFHPVDGSPAYVDCVGPSRERDYRHDRPWHRDHFQGGDGKHRPKATETRYTTQYCDAYNGTTGECVMYSDTIGYWLDRRMDYEICINGCEVVDTTWVMRRPGAGGK